MREFQYVNGTSSKFWVIHEPQSVGGQWPLHVHFGRIGTQGQSRVTVHQTYVAAEDDYGSRIQSKLGKGYVEVKASKKKKTKKKASVAKDFVQTCAHDHVNRLGGSKWRCLDCGNWVEFITPASKDKVPHVEEVAMVKRFINLNWRKTA
jgi:predicted DNA-binding WGR domain protein